MPAPAAMEEYFFDLLGYTLIEQALDPDHVQAINDWIDALPPLEMDQWYGNIDVHTYSGVDGMNLQNIIEGGAIFEALIDHPAWIDQVRHYIGKAYGPYINESFINIRGPGGFIGVHSGGHVIDSSKPSGRDRGEWCCSELSLLVALTDVGPGDGPTVLIPSSHKSDLQHPHDKGGFSDAGPATRLEGAVEVHMKTGDALLFQDFLCHGSAERTNPGQRRMVVFRYLASVFAHRWGYVPSPELLSRLTPARRKIIQPIIPRRPPADVQKGRKQFIGSDGPAHSDQGGSYQTEKHPY